MLGTFFVEGIIYIFSGIGKGNVDRRSNPLLRVVLVVWGFSLVGGVGVVLGSVGPVGCLWWWLGVVIFYMAVFCARGALPPFNVGAFSRF